MENTRYLRISKTSFILWCAVFLFEGRPGFPRSDVVFQVEPNVSLRLQSCSKGLRHSFFEPIVSPIRSKSGTPFSMSSSEIQTLIHRSPVLAETNTACVTPPRPGFLPTKPGTPGSSSARKYRKVGSKLIKTEEKAKSAIKIYQDPESVSPIQTREFSLSPL